jgi:hypothetical protein
MRVRKGSGTRRGHGRRIVGDALVLLDDLNTPEPPTAAQRVKQVGSCGAGIRADHRSAGSSRSPLELALRTTLGGAIL